jgi:hypothetical protein
MNWSQLSIGAMAGAVGTWLSGILKVGFEHWLDQRKALAAEERIIRTEKREEEKKAAEKLERDDATLLMLKTDVRGFTDVTDAADAIPPIRTFFGKSPEYLKIPSNRVFLEKYPQDFRDKLCYDSDNFKASLDQLIQDLELLQLRLPHEVRK